MLWTPAAKAAAGGEGRLLSAIDYYVTITNDALESSGTTLRIRSVGRQEVDYVEVPEESGTDLARLRDPMDGHMDEIHALRDTLGADLVSLIADNTDVGGIAYRMDDLRIGFGAYAFSLVTQTNVLYFAGSAFAHELGHNMGLAHDRFVSPDDDILHSFGRGYVNAAAFLPGAAEDACWRTIMAYEDRCAEAGFDQSVTVPYFSTPRLRYPDENGEPLGVPKTSDSEDDDGPADAVLVLEQSRLVVANFRSEHTDDGDTAATATTVAASSTTLAALDDDGDDVDYFRIELPQPGSLRVESTGSVDTFGTLTNESGALLAEDDDGGTRLNFLIERDLEAGTYFIKVEGSNRHGAGTGSYALAISFQPASETDDHGDTVATATMLMPASTVTVSLDSVNDVDYFRFELPQRGVLQAQTSGTTDTIGALSRAGDPFTFTHSDGRRQSLPQGGVHIGGGIVASNTISDDDSGPGGNFKIVGKFDPGTYYLAVRGWNHSQGMTTLDISFDGRADDHGDTSSAATATSLPATIAAELEAPLDKDYFRIEVAQSGILRLQTESDETDTWGTLSAVDGRLLARNDDGPGIWPNFGIAAAVVPGVYFLEVTGWYFSQGPYVLAASLDRVASIPLFIAHAHATQQGFARIVNRSDRDGTVTIYATDEGGVRSEPLRFELGIGQTRHFNSEDLEQGNPSKGLTGMTGDGEGNWRLELQANVDVDALAYVRTKDGFLTSMHDVVPAMPKDSGSRHRVVTFNPGSNRNQVSKLRLVNAGIEAADITIRGIDDDNAPAPQGDVALTLPAGQSRTVNAQDLEAGAQGLDGRFGDGSGKWQLHVDVDVPIVVMSLLESRTGHLTNLSAPTSRTSIPLFMRADHPSQQGFLRVMNRSNEAGTVSIQAIDDVGVAPDAVTLTIAAATVRHFNSIDLETGASAKGLSGGVGKPTAGNWRLELSTSLDIEAYSYVRTKDGFLTSMHDVAPRSGRGHEVVVFNPGSNENQASRLRLINPGTQDAHVMIAAVDDDGSAGEQEVVLDLPAGYAKEVTALQLETGGDGFEGRLGNGAGKWRLTVTADQTIEVMSLLEARRTGNLTNLSTRSAAGNP